jgi:hypothetical protein
VRTVCAMAEPESSVSAAAARRYFFMSYSPFLIR